MQVCSREGCDNEFEPRAGGRGAIQRYCSKACVKKRYRQSAKGRATETAYVRRYRKTPNGRAAYARYLRSDKSKARIARFRATEKGVMNDARNEIRRSIARNLQRLEELGTQG